MVDGIIPTNEHGNVEVFEGNAKFVPRGAVYLPFNEAGPVAEEMGLPWVEALVGFRVEGGRTLPIKQGIVCLEEDASVIREAAASMLAKQTLAREAKKEMKIARKWEDIVKKMMILKDLKEKYL